MTYLLLLLRYGVSKNGHRFYFLSDFYGFFANDSCLKMQQELLQTFFCCLKVVKGFKNAMRNFYFSSDFEVFCMWFCS